MRIMIFLASIAFVCSGYRQKSAHYNLAKLLKQDKLLIDSSNHAVELNDPVYKEAISLQRAAWLKNVSFYTGSIDIDLRGKDVFLQSFLGIAFHAKDKEHYEVIYFRPFNFNHADTSRRRWSVQYMVVPDFIYDKLRKEHPLVYENSLMPAPKANEWFHATMIVSNDSVKVFVNHSSVASLRVKRLVTQNDGMIGLWDDELSGDFANLVIEESKK